jgi:hypothetical protein
MRGDRCPAIADAAASVTIETHGVTEWRLFLSLKRLPILVSHSRRRESSGNGFLHESVENGHGTKTDRDGSGTGCYECAHNYILTILLAKG